MLASHVIAVKNKCTNSDITPVPGSRLGTVLNSKKFSGSFLLLGHDPSLKISGLGGWDPESLPRILTLVVGLDLSRRVRVKVAAGRPWAMGYRRRGSGWLVV